MLGDAVFKGASLQYRLHQIGANVEGSLVLAQPLHNLEYQVEGIIPLPNPPAASVPSLTPLKMDSIGLAVLRCVQCSLGSSGWTSSC